MGTRALLVFKKGNDKSYVYRLFDGYPEGVVADIYMLFKLLERINNESFIIHPLDPESLAVNYVVLSRLRYLYSQARLYRNDEPVRILSYILGGEYIVDTEDTELCEYKYVVDLDKKTITIQDLYDGSVEELTIDEAYKKYGKEYPHGCHIVPEYYEEMIRKLQK